MKLIDLYLSAKARKQYNLAYERYITHKKLCYKRFCTARRLNKNLSHKQLIRLQELTKLGQSRKSYKSYENI